VGAANVIRVCCIVIDTRRCIVVDIARGRPGAVGAQIVRARRAALAGDTARCLTFGFDPRTIDHDPEPVLISNATDFEVVRGSCDRKSAFVMGAMAATTQHDEVARVVAPTVAAMQDVMDLERARGSAPRYATPTVVAPPDDPRRCRRNGD
jgi:hypothetical protein